MYPLGSEVMHHKKVWTVDEIEWNMTSLHTEACLGYTHAKKPRPIPIPKEMWNIPVRGMKKGDSVALLYSSHQPILATPITGGVTLKALFRSIQLGMRVPIKERTARAMLNHHALMPFTTEWQKMLIKHAKAGRLRPVDLVGDHCFFEGDLHRNTQGVWVYSTGS